MKSEEIGFSSEGYQQACNILQSAVDANELMGGVLQVSRGGPALPVFCCGRRELSQGVASVVADTIFLIASITKPIVCASVVKLIEQGQVRLDDRVVYFVPEFGNRGKDAVTVRHLLTHTSGLPDMLPENHGLRAKHTPLSEFVAQMCDLDLLFEPGTRISYQSCGIAILGEIVERLEGRPLREVLHTLFFDPLGLADTSLGRLEDRRDRESEILIPETSDGGGGGTDWDWNSDYWRNFGAPWGGLFTTASDLTTLCQAFLFGGEVNETRVLSKATVRSMTGDQTSVMPDLPESEKSRQRWGLGWRLSDVSLYSDLVSPDTFGHSGATGTVAWMDPTTEVTCVILTNDPTGARSVRPGVSDAVAAAVN